MSTILVIDDNASNREFLATVLEYDGHRVISACDGAEGLAKTRAERPELVIADLLMPKMDGFEFVRQLRADPIIAQTNVIFHTAAYYEHEARDLARECGVTNILTKPSELQVVLKTVNEALGRTPSLPPGPTTDAFAREHLRLLTDKLSQKVTELEAVSLRLEAIIELSRELAAEPRPDRLLEHACHAAQEILGAAYGAVAILDEEGQVLYQYRVNGGQIETVADLRPLSPHDGIISTLLTERRPLRQCNPSGDPRVLGFTANHPPAYSFLGAPIVSSSRLYGWLGVQNKCGANEFSEEDERVATALAAQVAVAYENVLRYDAIQRHAAELEQRVEERTTELQRSNAELEQFAYVASHDLQEPLRKVVGYTQLLGKRYVGKLDADADEFITYAVDAARRMQQLIQDLLTYSRVGRQGKELALVDCEVILAQALRNLQVLIQENGALITHDPLPRVTADAGQFVQLFQNLIGNAIKFHGDQPPHVHVGVARQDHDWVFSVRDNGIGIDPQYAERIFLMFQRLHSRSAYPGTGIGLAVCQKIVQRHGGRIWVESQLGEGATFAFAIPESTHAAPETPSTAGERHS
jgi:signal transduction histidine kinase/DNA-binding response OmpR family regulator